MRIHCVSSRSKDSLSVVVFCYMLMCVGCFGLVVSTCQAIPPTTPATTLEIARVALQTKRLDTSVLERILPRRRPETTELCDKLQACCATRPHISETSLPATLHNKLGRFRLLGLNHGTSTTQYNTRITRSPHAQLNRR